MGPYQPDHRCRNAGTFCTYDVQIMAGTDLSSRILVLLVRQAWRRAVEHGLEGALHVTFPLNLRCSRLEALSPSIVACQLSQPVFLHTPSCNE